MNHYTYRITHKATGFFYEGVRSCECKPEDDDYYGSGARIRDLVKTYGKAAFTRTILETYETRRLAMNGERAIVSHEKLSDPYCLNIALGGSTHSMQASGESRLEKHTNLTISVMLSAGWHKKSRKQLCFPERWNSLSTLMSDSVRNEHFILIPLPSEAVFRLMEEQASWQ